MADSIDARGSTSPFSAMGADFLALIAPSRAARGSLEPFCVALIFVSVFLSSGALALLEPFDLIADNRAARGSLKSFFPSFFLSLFFETIAERVALRGSIFFNPEMFDCSTILAELWVLSVLIALDVSLVGISGSKRTFSF